MGYPSRFVWKAVARKEHWMTARLFVSHLVVGALALGLGWFLSRATDGPPAGIEVSEPVAELAAILRLDDPNERAVSLARFFESTDPAWASRLREELIAAREDEFNVDEIAEILFASWWAKSDPSAAFGNIVHPPWANRHPWVRTVVQEWMRKDPLAALAAIETMPQTRPTMGIVEAARFALDGWLSRDDLGDPEPLFGLVRQLDLKARGRAIERILDSLILKRGVDATEQFVGSLPIDPDSLGVDVSKEMVARMGVALLDYDVDRAIAWAAKHGEGPQNVGVLKHLAFYWAARDGPAAMAWARSLPESRGKRFVIKRAWMSFGKSRTEKARTWLEAQEPDQNLAQIYAQYVRILAREQPERALELANKATDSEVRDRLVVAAARGWMSSDPESARAWIVSSGISEELEQQISQIPAGDKAS